MERHSSQYNGHDETRNGNHNDTKTNNNRKPIRKTSVMDSFDVSCKVMLLGDSGVGKTCLLVRFKDGAFLSGSFISTVGIDFRNKVVEVDGTKVKLQIWDTAGQERFRSVTHAYYRDANALLLLYDVTNKASFDNIRNKVVEVDGTKVKLQIWDTAGQERFRSVTHAYYRDANALLLLYDVTNKASFDNIRAWLTEINEYAQEDVVIMLLGNKADMAGERIIKQEDGEKLARDHGVAFMETSAKTGMNVELAFMAIARDLKMKKTRQPTDPKFNVAEYVDKEKKTPGCCS